MSDVGRITVATERPRAFFTPKDLGDYLGLSIRTVRQILAEGKIASYTFEGARRIAAEDVDAYVAANRAENARRAA